MRSLKNLTFKGGFTKSRYRVRGLPKKGRAWTVCRFKGEGGLGEKEGAGDTPMHMNNTKVA